MKVMEGWLERNIEDGIFYSLYGLANIIKSNESLE